MKISFLKFETINFFILLVFIVNFFACITLNDALNKAAYDHSLEMETYDNFSHTGLNNSSFSDRAITAGYNGSPLGENIAWGQRTPEAVFNAWINSDGHKANILKANATEMGLGVSGVYWTQIFGKENESEK